MKNHVFRPLYMSIAVVALILIAIIVAVVALGLRGAVPITTQLRLSTVTALLLLLELRRMRR